ncbi:MAG: hypothetical protein COY38_04080 [Candidatus Aenigmarchaeota archaeon CG_4_10_14_0_8_um_filter_37_24]|nr:MAG: hypothetical protein COS07_04165 [Candidatus Aenigmarchaeota archaeon CG01_land_8_20_14_3_00_37_9]PIW40845.1 MAG: hypothetical protein COW21_05040 [Candidatus Aenigmarchaeota archaeon CG15_BIG_FIL_POST_REV_8_21_14_020_37_27]PIX51218.1 MAG: hypothetical protein COZ52_00065 [Candidatus Aenigmarchaeota archaeon CG_4_8_14_3_um_filter_37_24]PIY34818.1 MAG: hypothetical protein COZ04_05690 [Candidatus Aenigmarchaeota archaeon CG_4_10_14_3_um_filter_37_21]PIZ34551.1 MAG: hypothetical protein C
MITFNDIIIYIALFFSLFSVIFFLTIYIENKNEVKKGKPKKQPKISVIIPAYNEGKNILESIKSVLKAEYPEDRLEVIVVDDHSEDDTFKQAKTIESKSVRVFTKKHGGKAAAVNYGIKKSTGEIVMVLDADTFPDKNCFKNIIGYFENPEIMAALPAIKIWKPKTIVQKCQAIEYSIMGLLKKAFFFMGSMSCTPAGAFIRKEFIRKHGGFATNTLTEDFEMGLKIQSKNYQIAQSLDSQVCTIAPDKIKKLLRQRVRWNYGSLENILKYKNMLSPRYGDLGMFLLPLALFSVGFVSFLLLYFLVKLILDLSHQIYLNSLINFDIIRMFSFNGKLSFSGLITNEKTFLVIFMMMAAFAMYEIARRNAKEKFKLEYLIYFIFYGWIMSLSQLIALLYFISGKKPKW